VVLILANPFPGVRQVGSIGPCLLAHFDYKGQRERMQDRSEVRTTLKRLQTIEMRTLTA
jgi:hypothetical protein